MLDLHVLVHNARRDWVDQCKASIDEAVRHAGYPVAVHYVVGEHGHIGRGRAKGYALGSYPYVLKIDDDDYIAPNALALLAPHLRRGVPVVAAKERYLVNEAMSSGVIGHGFVAFKRELLISHAVWKCCGDIAQLVALQHEPRVDLPDEVYIYRLYHTSWARQLRRQCPDEFENLWQTT